MTSTTHRSDILTYRYPRTMQELQSRFPCNGEEAQAIHGPYTAEWEGDAIVGWTTALSAVALIVMALLGWL
jgi:hypothetical protein